MLLQVTEKLLPSSPPRAWCHCACAGARNGPERFPGMCGIRKGLRNTQQQRFWWGEEYSSKESPTCPCNVLDVSNLMSQKHLTAPVHLMPGLSAPSTDFFLLGFLSSWAMPSSNRPDENYSDTAPPPYHHPSYLYIQSIQWNKFISASSGRLG